VNPHYFACCQIFSGGKTQVQFVLSVKLRLRPSDEDLEADPSTSVEESADAFTVPRRFRDFQGLNENVPLLLLFSFFTCRL
jgi:hypothetical protein